MDTVAVDKLRPADRAEWRRIYGAYLDFCGIPLDEAGYTFIWNRVVAGMVRNGEGEDKDEDIDKDKRKVEGEDEGRKAGEMSNENDKEMVYALVTRDEHDPSRLTGIVQFYYHMTLWTTRPTCTLNDLYVDPQVRGKGLGRALILATQKAAREKQAVRVRWVTMLQNNTSRRLYDSLAPGDFIEYRMSV